MLTLDKYRMLGCALHQAQAKGEQEEIQRIKKQLASAPRSIRRIFLGEAAPRRIEPEKPIRPEFLEQLISQVTTKSEGQERARDVVDAPRDLGNVGSPNARPAPQEPAWLSLVPSPPPSTHGAFAVGTGNHAARTSRYVISTSSSSLTSDPEEHGTTALDIQEAKLWHRCQNGVFPDSQRAYCSAMFSLSARATRRKSLCVIVAIASLCLLVIGISADQFFIREAQNEAGRVAHQLELTQAAEQATMAEHTKALAAYHQLEDKNAALLAAYHQLEGKNAALVAALNAAEQARNDAETARTESEAARAVAEEARQKAEKAKQRESKIRRAALEAIEDVQAAREAEAKAERANAALEARLAQEEKRVRDLEALTRGVKIIPDVGSARAN